MNPSRYYEVKREIEAILDDSTLPRYLQVSRIINLFDTKGGADIIDVWPDEISISTEGNASGSNKPSRPKKKTAKKKAVNKKRAKTTKSRS